MPVFPPSRGALARLHGALRALLRPKAPPQAPGLPAEAGRKSRNDRGLLTFEHTGEVIRAERLLRAAGLEVEVKGPPPELRTGCDMVVVFPLLLQARVLTLLQEADLAPLRTVTAHDVLLEPVSLFQIRRVDGRWLMVRAANIKITLDTADNRIVNISGGGCPDVPWLASRLCGCTLDAAPAPLSLGQTLCCYSLQKAFDHLKTVMAGQSAAKDATGHCGGRNSGKDGPTGQDAGRRDADDNPDA